MYADGAPDELVRGVDIVGTPLAAMSRILVTGDTSSIFKMGACGAESGGLRFPRRLRRFCSLKLRCRNGLIPTNDYRSWPPPGLERQARHSALAVGLQ